MLQKLFTAAVALLVTAGFAFAQVDVNKADQAALDGIKGVGPSTSKAILDERKKGGEFKDWTDFESRVKGVGEKNAVKLSDAGLTVNGRARAGVTESVAKDGKKAGKEAKKDVKKEDSKK